MPATASPTGELPLSLAACTNQPELVDLLLGASASVVEQDSHGNTVLHALVMVADDDSHHNTRFIKAMYDHILLATAKVNTDWRLESKENKEGLTPLKLAAKTGKVEVKLASLRCSLLMQGGGGRDCDKVTQDQQRLDS